MTVAMPGRLSSRSQRPGNPNRPLSRSMLSQGQHQWSGREPQQAPSFTRAGSPTRAPIFSRKCRRNWLGVDGRKKERRPARSGRPVPDLASRKPKATRKERTVIQTQLQQVGVACLIASNPVSKPWCRRARIPCLSSVGDAGTWPPPFHEVPDQGWESGGGKRSEWTGVCAALLRLPIELVRSAPAPYRLRQNPVPGLREVSR